MSIDVMDIHDLGADDFRSLLCSSLSSIRVTGMRTVLPLGKAAATPPNAVLKGSSMDVCDIVRDRRPRVLRSP